MIAFMFSSNSFTISIPQHTVNHQSIHGKPIPATNFSWEAIKHDKVKSKRKYGIKRYLSFFKILNNHLNQSLPIRFI